MSNIAILAGALAVLPVAALLMLGWFAIMSEASTVHSFDGAEHGRADS